MSEDKCHNISPQKMDIAEKFDIPQSSLPTILKNQDLILKHMNSIIRAIALVVEGEEVLLG